jgi:hypothetical protein
VALRAKIERTAFLLTRRTGTVVLMASAVDEEGAQMLKNFTLVIDPLQPRFGLR